MWVVNSGRRDKWLIDFLLIFLPVNTRYMVGLEQIQIRNTAATLTLWVSPVFHCHQGSDIVTLVDSSIKLSK